MTLSVLSSMGAIETVSALAGAVEAVSLQSQQFEREGNWQGILACEQFLIQAHQLMAALKEPAP